MSQKTILLTSYSYLPNIGGIENSLRYLAKSYQSFGYKVVMVVSKTNDAGLQLADKEVIEDVTIYRYDHLPNEAGAAKLSKHKRIEKSVVSLYQQIAKEHDVVLTVSRFHTTTVYAKKAGLPNIVYLVPGVVKFQDSGKNAANVTGLSKLKAFITKTLHHNIQVEAFKCADQVMIFSNNMQEQISKVIPSIGKLPIVKPGVDNVRFSPAADKETLRTELGLPKNKYIVMVIGRMVKAKGFEYVIDAMKSMHNGHLLIVGDGPNKEALIAQAESLGLTDSVTFTGSQSDTAPYYQASDCFVMSSIYEPLGQTILEALACGLPIVAFNDNLVTTATKEMLSDNEAAYVNALSADELASTLNGLMADETKSNRLSQSSRDIAVDRFSWDSLAKNMLAQFGGDSVR